MNKFVPLVLATVLCGSVSAQQFQKARKENSKNILRNTVTNSFKKSIQPSLALRVTDQGDVSITDTISYDRFGNETDMKNKTYRHVTEYDQATGRVLLNDYSQVRISETSPWEAPKYVRKTTLNSDGIRIAIEDRDYKKIELDNMGRVILTDDGDPEEGEIDQSTYTWEGDKLVSFTSDYKAEEKTDEWEEEHITINNIEILYEALPFNPYEIDIMDYMTELEDSRIAYNASGTYSDGTTTSPITIISTVSEDKKEITTKVQMGDVQESFQKFTYTDDYGSYRYESVDEEGDKYIEVYTYNEYGDLVRNEYEEYEEGKVTYSGYSRYEWMYDSNKPTSRKYYYRYSGNDKEYLGNTEYFKAWYEGESIHNLQAGEGEVLGATLYTLTGTPLRTFSAEEVNATISLPEKGIYLLNIRTSKGNVVKKIIR